MKYIEKSILKKANNIILCDEIINNCNKDINKFLSLIDGYVLNDQLNITSIENTYKMIDKIKSIRDDQIKVKNKNIDKIHNYINKYQLPYKNYMEVLNHENI